MNRILEEMSAREKMVTRLLIEGVTNRDIALRFRLSERTVQGHRNNIYRRLRVHSLAELRDQMRFADLRLLDEPAQEREAL